MEQLGSHWTDFHKIWYLRIFRKSVHKIKFSLKSDMNKRWNEDQYTFLIISRSFLLRMRNVWDKSCIENQNTHFVFGNFFFSKIVSFVRQCLKILWCGTGHRWQYGACALHVGYLGLQTHTQVVLHSLLVHCNNGFTNALQCYVTCALPVFFILWLSEVYSVRVNINGSKGLTCR